MDNLALITLTDSRSAAAEAYRALRMNLSFTSLDKPLSAVAVSSPGPNLTKSQVAANLAVVVAQSGKSVVLVDADLRRPHLHEIFDVPQEPGVTTFMLGQAKADSLPLIKTKVPGLSLLPAGALPPNPADILGSKKMSQLLESLQKQADLVIIDVPPVTVAVDASVLAGQTDGLLLVVRAGQTRRDRIEQSKEMLQRSQVRLLGAVFTDSNEGGLLTGY